MRKLFLPALVAASPAFAQEDGAGPNLVIEIAGEANGRVVIDMFDEAAPAHVEQITGLAEEGAYDNVVFHRVIDGFMAQTGDVEFGKLGDDMRMAGRGGSSRPDLPAEFSDIPYDRGIVGMARAQDPNSAGSQFFLCLDRAAFLDGQYTVFGKTKDQSSTDNVTKIGGVATGPGDRPVEPVTINKATVTESAL